MNNTATSGEAAALNVVSNHALFCFIFCYKQTLLNTFMLWRAEPKKLEHQSADCIVKVWKNWIDVLVPQKCFARIDRRQGLRRCLPCDSKSRIKYGIITIVKTDFMRSVLQSWYWLAWRKSSSLNKYVIDLYIFMQGSIFFAITTLPKLE